MVGGNIVRCLAAMMVAGMVLANTAHTQGPDDLDQLLAEVSRLHG